MTFQTGPDGTVEGHSIDVRPVATDQEVESVVDLIGRFHSESFYKRTRFAADRVRRNAIRFRDQPERRLVAPA